jgi:LysM repeat protein
MARCIDRMMLFCGLMAGCGSPLVNSGPRMSSGPVVDSAGRSASAGGATTATPTAYGDVPRIPIGQIVPQEASDQPALYHLVRPGETLANIASQYRVSVGRIVDANGLDSAGAISAGQRLYIPRDK